MLKFFTPNKHHNMWYQNLIQQWKWRGVLRTTPLFITEELGFLVGYYLQKFFLLTNAWV